MLNIFGRIAAATNRCRISLHLSQSSAPDSLDIDSTLLQLFLPIFVMPLIRPISEKVSQSPSCRYLIHNRECGMVLTQHVAHPVGHISRLRRTMNHILVCTRSNRTRSALVHLAQRRCIAAPFSPLTNEFPGYCLSNPLSYVYSRQRCADQVLRVVINVKR